MMRFEETQEPPPHLRDAYLSSLPEPQELFLETHVEAGTTLLVGEVAYVVFLGSQLVEFYVAPEQAHQTVQIFDTVMAASGASSVLAKSFDAQLLYAAFAHRATVETVGLMFRRISDPSFSARDDVVFRAGTVADADAVYAFNDDFFESIEEIQRYAATGGLFVLEQRGEPVGCGIGKPVVANRPDIDIGMLVAEAHRRNGYGAHIISYLKDHYLTRGLRPICGCSVGNVGSQRALKTAGFVNEHRLLEITY